MSKLTNNTTNLQFILETINNLPDASTGVELPELTNPADTNEIFLNKQTIDADGKIRTGTFTIDNELNEQEDLLIQITAALEGKATGGEQATPEIEVDSNGLITATAGTKSSTYQLAFQPAKTITPSATSQVAVSSGYYTGGNITVGAIPSNYIIPSGTLNITTSGTHDVKNYASATVAVTGGGVSEEEVIAEFLETNPITIENSEVFRIRTGIFAFCGNLTSVNFPECVNIESHAFYSCSKLASINFPKCVNIGNDYTFYYCSNLTSVSFPKCTYVGRYAFANCTKLASANFPSCESIGVNAFNGCSKLASINFPVCTSVLSGAFSRCIGLTFANFPECSYIGSYAFCWNSSLTSVNFPNCTIIGGSAFADCPNLTFANFPVCLSIGSYAFSRCESLASMDLPICTYISQRAFYNCYRLSSIVLGASTVCTMLESNVFYSTPYKGNSSYFSGTPYIYVPASLIDAYKSATNWVYFSSYFSTIESLEE